MRLSASVNDHALQTSEYTSAGDQIYVQDVPPTALQANASPLIRFELERAFKGLEPDRRELGVQVRFWAYCNEVRRAVNAIEIV